MPSEQSQSDNQKADNQQADEKYRDLVNRVANQVWKLWKEELNRDRERRGNLHRSG